MKSCLLWIIITGQKHWSYKVQQDVISAMTSTNNRIFVGTLNGHIYALDITSGREVWTSDITWGIIANGSSLAVADDILLVGVSPVSALGLEEVGDNIVGPGNLYALDVTTGRGFWAARTDTSGGVWGISVAGGKVFVSSGNQVYAFSG